MKSTQVLLLLGVVAGMATGQILFKLAALSMAGTDRSQFILWRFANGYFLSAVGIYLATTFLWVWILRSVALNLAYPFTAGVFFLVPLLGSIFLGEAFGIRHVLGNLLIFAGILIIAR